MYPVNRLLNWGGATSLALGGLLSLVALFKSKEARQLEAAVSLQSLAGNLWTGVVDHYMPLSTACCNSLPLPCMCSTEAAPQCGALARGGQWASMDQQAYQGEAHAPKPASR